ncbi:hypothetical protein [Geobacter sp. OR-1]|uniref:hypothetical protein n=1 Tax=Geobacter sp. OR-1 TaxID=1266765 RepID=UPI001269ADD7|nr:hypothetical protein [Geobacter sp. OR-1]
MSLCLIAIALAASASSQPRVSGVVGQEGAWVLAIIETDAGTCSVVSKGDRIGDGIVSEISARGLQVTYGTETEFLPLLGGTFTKTSDHLPADAARTTSLNVSRNDTVTALERPDGNKKQSVNEIIGLPLSAHISAINGTIVTSQQEAGKVLLEQLKTGRVSRLNVSGVPGMTEIYLVTDPPPELPENADIPPWERTKPH